MNNFKELKVWQKSVELVIDVYKITKKFPTDERFGLISQINRCAISIPSNIAEGAGRNSKKEFIHFLAISLGSSCELETQIIISEKLSFISLENKNLLIDEITQIQKMINSLQNTLK